MILVNVIALTALLLKTDQANENCTKRINETSSF